MGFRFRKSINLPFGTRINLSKSGIGYSYGFKGFRHTIKANGGTRDTYSIPGSGISYVKENGKQKQVDNNTENSNEVINNKKIISSDNYCCYCNTYDSWLSSQNVFIAYILLLFARIVIPIIMLILLAIIDSSNSNMPVEVDIVVLLAIFGIWILLFTLGIIEVIRHFKSRSIVKIIDDTYHKIGNINRVCNGKPIVYSVSTKSLNEYSRTVPTDVLSNMSIESIENYIEQMTSNSKLVDEANILIDKMTGIISNSNIIIRRYDSDKIYTIFRIVDKIKEQKDFIIEITYTSPAGRNHYEKRSRALTIDDLNKIIEMKRLKEEMKRAQQEHEKQRQEQQRQEQQRQQYEYNRQSDEVHDAMILFMLSEPFTMDEVKKQRNKLLKTYHSDNNINDDTNKSEEYTVRINTAYEVLEKYLKNQSSSQQVYDNKLKHREPSTREKKNNNSTDNSYSYYEKMKEERMKQEINESFGNYDFN